MSNLFVKISAWVPDQVANWLRGLDSILQPYVQLFLDAEVSGERLLNLDAYGLQKLGVEKLGHQELILEAVQLLFVLHYELENENLQSLALKLSCCVSGIRSEMKAFICERLLVSTINNHMSERLAYNNQLQLPVVLLASISDAAIITKKLASWLDRSPFVGSGGYIKMRNAFVKLGIELLCSVQGQCGTYEEDVLLNTCLEINKLCEKIIIDSKDSLIIQPASLELATIRKKPDEDLGMHIQSTYVGTHMIGGIKLETPAYYCGKIDQGDEIIQVNYQTVVGWRLPKLIEVLRANQKDVTLTLKKRPHHVSLHSLANHKRRVSRKNKTSSGVSSLAEGKSRKSSKKRRTPLPDLIYSVPMPTEPFYEALKETESDNENDSDVFSGSSSHTYSTEPKQRRATVSGGSPLLSLASLSVHQDGSRPKSCSIVVSSPSSESSEHMSQPSPSSVTESVHDSGFTRKGDSLCYSFERVHIRRSSDSVGMGSTPEFTVPSSASESDALSSTSESEAPRSVSELAEASSWKFSAPRVATQFSEPNAPRYVSKFTMARAMSETAAPRSMSEFTAPRSMSVFTAPRSISEVTTPQSVSKSIEPWSTSDSAIPMSAHVSTVPRSTSELTAPRSASESAVPISARMSTVPRSISELAAPRSTSEFAAPWSTYELAAPRSTSEIAAPRSASESAVPMSTRMSTVPRSISELAAPWSTSELAAPRSTPELAAPRTAYGSAVPTFAHMSTASRSTSESAVPMSVRTTAVPRSTSDSTATEDDSSLTRSPRLPNYKRRLRINACVPVKENDTYTTTSKQLSNSPPTPAVFTPPVAEIKEVKQIREHESPSKEIPGDFKGSPQLVRVRRIDSRERGRIHIKERREQQKEPEWKSAAAVAPSLSNTENPPLEPVSYMVNIVGGVAHKWPCDRDVKENNHPPPPSPSMMLRRNLQRKLGGDRRISCKDLGSGDCQGWLWKRRDSGSLISSKWVKRWFVLKSQVLYYYKSPDDQKAQGVIHLPAFQVSPAAEIKSKKFAFKLHNTGTTFFFAAERQTDMSKWMNKMGLASICLETNRTTPMAGFVSPVPSTPSTATSHDNTAFFSESDDEAETDGLSAPVTPNTSRGPSPVRHPSPAALRMTRPDSPVTMRSHSPANRQHRNEPVAHSDDMAAVYHSIESADLGIDGVNVKLKRTSTLTSADQACARNSAELQYSRRICSLQRTLKDKLHQYEIINTFLSQQVTVRMLRDFISKHPDIIREVMGDVSECQSLSDEEDEVHATG